MRDPIIFIGMHRSGTSMLGRMLEELGVFFGAHKDINNEALFFQDLNEWLLAQCGGRWDYPKPFNQYFWRNEEVIKWTEVYLRNLLASPRVMQFLGVRRYLSGGMRALNEPWGWKDPRTTFTLPVWLRIFPNARVVSIERNGVDVAQSLLTREREILGDAPRFYRKYRLALFLQLRRGGFAHSPRCLELEDAFSLWEEYTAQSDRVIEQVPPDRILALRYEDVLADPVRWLNNTATFCKLEARPNQIERAASKIKADRAQAYESDADLARFAAAHAAALSARGYAAPNTPQSGRSA